jgi:membrane protease YdiL (CAAX protease family)
MASLAFEVGSKSSEGSKWWLAGEVALVLTVTAASLAALPVTRVIEGGLLEHALMLLRMIVLLGAATWLLRRTGHSWSDVGLSRPKSWWRVAALVAAGYAMLAVVMMVLLPAALQLAGASPPKLAAFAALKNNLLQYLFFAIPVSLGTAAFIEEMFARGYLLNRLAQIFGPGRSAHWWLAAIAQGVLFGIAHSYQGLGGVIVTSMIGILFGALYLIGRRNLWACIILHGLIDLVTMTAFFLGAAN